MDGDERLRSGGDDPLEAISVLDDPRQRRLLSVLRDGSCPMTLRDLAVRLAAEETGVAPSAVTAAARRRIRVDLHHRCLPKLEALGWIERYPEGAVADDPPSLAGERASLLERCGGDQPTPDALDALLARPRRRAVVSIVADRRRLTLAELASELAAGGDASWGRTDETDVRCRLHHVDLPRLAEADLLEYDPEERTVTRTRALETLVAEADPVAPKTGLATSREGSDERETEDSDAD